MLHLFRRTGAAEGVPIDGAGGTVLTSHILVKFLKRLRQMERPYLLDLGRLSGSNIEFFAQRGCKVQVEDLLLALEADAPSEGALAAPTPAPEAPRAPAPQTIASPLSGVGPVVPAPSGAPAIATGRALPPAGVVTRPGARPSRRIVLPPRTFSSTFAARGVPDGGRPRGPAVPERNPPLPSRFDYPDESFDAIVAWDIFNYYGPAAMTSLAAEARRILKPNGLLLAYFMARRPEGPETPRRYRILDEARVASDPQPGPRLRRSVYQNRDIEKMFAGLSIVELYFLKTATRELLMEKKAARLPGGRAPAKAAAPRPRFTLE